MFFNGVVGIVRGVSIVLGIYLLFFRINLIVFIIMVVVLVFGIKFCILLLSIFSIKLVFCLLENMVMGVLGFINRKY